MSGRLDQLLGKAGVSERGAAKKKMSPTMAIVANIGMFILTAAICFGLVRGLRSFAFAGVGAPDYVLTTTRQIEAGEPISADNAVWKLASGHAPAASVVAHSDKTPLSGYTAISRIGPGKPVRMALVAKAETNAAPTKATALGGYVLSGDDAAKILPYVKPGVQLDVVAIVSNADGRNVSLDPAAQVATVITNAEVTGVIHASTVGHGANARSGSVVIAVTDEQARLLGVLSHFATLEFVLSPRRLTGIDQPGTAWRKLAELGLPGNDWAPESEAKGAVAPRPVAAIAARTPRQDAAVETEEAAPSVAVITPAGVTQSPVRQ